MDQTILLTGQQLAVRERAKRHSVPVIEEGIGTLEVGSCILFARGSRRFLVTASHVAAGMVKGTVAVAIGESKSQLVTPGTGTLAYTEEHDVAVMELKDRGFLNSIESANYRQFLTDDDVHRGPLPHDILVYGFPGEDVKQDGDDLFGESIMICTEKLSSDPGELVRPSTQLDLFLAWQGEKTKCLHGISGSPIWAVTDPIEGVWTPERALKVCAIETSVKTGEWIRGSLWDVVDLVLHKMGVPS